MLDSRATQIALLIWGSIFCLIATLCMVLSRNFENRKRKWMICMQIATAFLLGSDAVAWIFRGYLGTAGAILVRISNFMVFEASNVILLFFHTYVCRSILPKKQSRVLLRERVVYILGAIGILLVLVSQFTNLLYYFDSSNIYHRTSLYGLSMVTPVLGMMIDFSLLIQYRRNVSRHAFVAMSSYIVLPLAAAAIQIMHYGISLINLSIGVSMLLMFAVAMAEQSQELRKLSIRQNKTEAQLEISTTLNRCVTELSTDTDIDAAIYNLLGIITDYFKADRSYIFELNKEKNMVANTHEYVKDGVVEQIQNLQEIPVEVISVWMESFKRDCVYYISNLEQEKGSETYEILKAQDIERLLAVPLWKDGDIIGFLGVDNPMNHYDDATLLSSIQYFVSNSLSTKKQKEQLQYLSYRDMLTNLYNRNRYMYMLETYEKMELGSTGVAYIDLNGLKKINDQQGHEAGDCLIQKAAKVIADIFPEHSYRVGGDEFVIIFPGVAQAEFEKKMQLMQEDMTQQQVSVAIGSMWKSEVMHLQDMLKDADRDMYKKKEEYYRITGDYHR